VCFALELFAAKQDGPAAVGGEMVAGVEDRASIKR
jgi:hypothetical protein